MIDNGRGQDAKNDRDGFFKTRGEDEGKELGFVAYFRKGDHTGRDKERFHKCSQAGLQTIDHDTPPAFQEASWSKVLPG
jgi:hypothetical protein